MNWNDREIRIAEIRRQFAGVDANKRRRELPRDVNQYLAAGGKITYLPNNVANRPGGCFMIPMPLPQCLLNFRRFTMSDIIPAFHISLCCAGEIKLRRGRSLLA